MLTRVQDTDEQLSDDLAFTQAGLAIDLLMVWSSDALGRIASLGQMSYYAEGAAFEVVAPRMLDELDRFEAQLKHLPAIIAHARIAALDALGEGEVAA